MGSKRGFRHAYNTQRSTAKGRGIAFLLSYAEWLDWWGNDIANRGCKEGQLCMARVGDIGPYEVGNIYKATQAQNMDLVRDRVSGQAQLPLWDTNSVPYVELARHHEGDVSLTQR
jgi:hypothetical protein